MRKNNIKKTGIVTAVMAFITALAMPAIASAAPTVTDYPVLTSSSTPTDIVEGANGNMWFTEQSANKIGEITSSGTVSEFTVPTSSSGPTGITEGPDGNIWFTEENTGNVASYDPSTSTFSTYTINVSSFPVGITSAGGDLWVVGQDSLDLYEVNTSGTVVNTFQTNFGGNYVTEGPDGRLWVTAGAHLMAFTTSGTESDYNVPGTSPSAAGCITVGPNNNLWFTNSGSNTIDEVTTLGTFTAFSVPTASSSPAFIVSGQDGNLWFTEQTANNVVSLSTSGTFTAYSIPTAASSPLGIAQGPNNTLWFAESAGNRIGEVSGLVVPSSGGGATTGAPNTGYGQPRTISSLMISLVIVGAIAVLGGLLMLYRQLRTKKS